MKKTDDYLVLAKIVGYHGLQGHVKVKVFTESLASFEAYKTFYITVDGAQVALDVENVKQHGRSVVVKFKQYNDRTQAEELGKALLAIPADDLPTLDDHEYYWRELVGLVVTSDDGCLGVVDHLLETGSNDVLVVKPTADSLDDRERLLPYLPDVIRKVDLTAGNMMVVWDSEF